MASDSEDMSHEDEMGFEDLEQNEDDIENEDQDQEDEQVDDYDNQNGEDDDSAMNEEKPAKKAKKLSKSDKGEIATEEFQRLKETVELYKSSLFRLQMDELLKEVRVQYDKTIAIDRAVASLKKIFDSIKQKEINLTPETLKGMKDVPLKHRNDPQTLSKTPFVFQKPSRVDVVGSFVLKTVTKPMLNIDLAVEIPQSVFRENDRLNFVYHDKRALYLKFLAQEISQHPQFKDVSWTSFGGDITKPVLQIAPAKDPELNVKTMFVIRILPTVDKDTFKKMAKFLPDRNNNRPNQNATTAKKTKGNNNASNESNLPATPHYNSWIMEDMLFRSHAEYLQGILKQSMNGEFQNACMLLKTFLHKRGMDATYDGFNGFMMTMLLAHLVNIRVINLHMSSYQMFRMVIQFLAKLDPKKGIFMKPGMIPSDVETFLTNFDFAFVDPYGVFNMAHRMSIHAFKELQRECSLALTFLSDKAIDGFDALFLQQNHFHLRYDNYFVVYNVGSLHEKAQKAVVKDAAVQNHFYDWGNWNMCYRRKLLELVEQGLTDRVTVVRDSPLTRTHWKLNETVPFSGHSTNTFSENILIGFCLNPERARSVLDHGPPANDPLADEYKRFWGDKAETRRFRDGSIEVATVWEEVPLSSRHLLIDHILTYVLQRHLNVREKDLYFISHQLDGVLRNPFKEDPDTTPTIISQFDTLCKQLRGLEDLPLAIANIYPVSPVFRYTSVFPVLPARGGEIFNDMYLPQMRVIIQFESSSKWPDEMEAIHQMKLAFYLQISHSLKKAHPEYFSQVTETHLEITANWFVYNFYIYHEKELYLLSKNPKTEGLSRDLHLEYFDKPMHGQMMSAFNQRYPVFGNIVRFAMRWLHSHMLGGQISQEFVELVVAYMVLQSRPYDRPATPFIGFLRLLSFFVHFDFKEVPLIVDPDTQLTEHDYNDIMATFNAVREKFPNQYAVFIATPLDMASALWSRAKPTPSILKRITAQAQRSYDHILKQFSSVLSHTQVEEWKSIFAPSLEDYDLVIHLRGMELPNYHYNVHFALGSKSVKELTQYLPRSFAHFSKTTTRGLHPIKEYIKDLEATYGDRALFFYDEHGGDVIGVIWKPSLFLPQPFKVGDSAREALPVTPSLVNPPQQSGSKKRPFTFQVVPNIREIVKHMSILGGKLVDTPQATNSAYRL